MLVVQITEAIIEQENLVNVRVTSEVLEDSKVKGRKHAKKVLQHSISLTLGNSVENLKDSSFEECVQ